MAADRAKASSVRLRPDVEDELRKRYRELGYRSVSHLIRDAVENRLRETKTSRNAQLDEFLQVRLKVLEKKAEDFDRQLTYAVLRTGHYPSDGPSVLGNKLKTLIEELIQEIKTFKP